MSKSHPSDRTQPKVKPGKTSPGSLNPQLPRRMSRRQLSVSDYVAGIRGGDRVVLSRAITLIESTRPEHQALGQQVIEACLPHRVESLRIGITGTPGVGKSTFIEAFGRQLIGEGRKVAVLTIDPTSQVSRGSILGDKTRMPKLAASEQAFIRPSPAGDSLGGVARKTRETILLCEAAGYGAVIVETVGVGQSEVAVHSMVDFFLLLLLPGAGDELQGIKRGIVEMADLIAVNKADEERLQPAKRARQEYRNALHLLPPKESRWQPQVVICSALSGMGIDEVWQLALDFQRFTIENGYFHRQRREQARFWLRETIDHRLRRLFYEHPAVQAHLSEIEAAVLAGRQSSFRGAEQLLDYFLRNDTSDG